MKTTKVLLIVCAVLTLAACKTKNPYIQYSTVIDYYKGGLNGKVLLTEATSVTWDYEAVGSVYAECRDGYEVLDSTIVSKYDPIAEYNYRDTKHVKYKLGDYKYADVTTTLEEASRKALANGGDAIICLRVNNIMDEVNGKWTVIGYTVTGMAVRRK